MFNASYWGALGKQSAVKIKPNDYRESDTEMLTYYIYQNMLKTKASDAYATFADKQTDEIYSLAAEKAKRAIEHYGGLIVCGDCNTPKECTHEVTHNGVYKQVLKVPCMCNCAIDAEANHKAQVADYAKQEARDAISNASKSKAHEFERHTFANDDRKHPEVSNFAHRYCEELINADNGFAMSGVMLYGPPGTGKTYMACCIANELTSHGYFCHITSSNAIISNMWDEEKRQTYIGALKKYDLIVIDDFGAEHKSKSEYEKDLLESLINELYNSSKRLVVTTNMEMADFKRNLDIQEMRMYDRLLQMCQYRISVSGVSRRREELRQNFTAVQKQIDEWMQ